MFGFSLGELIGLGVIGLFVFLMLRYAVRNTKGPGGPGRWGR